VGGDVVLMRSNKPFTVRFYDLTPADQEYVKDLLTSQGQQSLIPPPPPAPREAPQDAPAPAEAPAPPPPAAPPAASSPEPNVPRGPTDAFERMRELDQQRRQAQADRLAAEQKRTQDLNDRMQQHHDQTQSRMGAVRGTAQGTDAATNGPAGAAGDASDSGKVDPKIAADTRQIIIISIVVVGVLGTVAVIVFVAITIASVSSVREQRQYR
jgi:hypothetical protein